MKNKLCVLILLLGLPAIVCAVPRPASAALGEQAESIEADRKALSAVRSPGAARNGYTVQTIVSAAAEVREYVSSTGVVFGIAWNGLSHPDLTPLLGSYADDFGKAQRQARHEPGRRHSQIKGERVVVEKWGHMRNLQGRAYAPALIPPGVGVDEIR